MGSEVCYRDCCARDSAHHIREQTGVCFNESVAALLRNGASTGLLISGMDLSNMSIAQVGWT